MNHSGPARQIVASLSSSTNIHAQNIHFHAITFFFGDSKKNENNIFFVFCRSLGISTQWKEKNYYSRRVTRRFSFSFLFFPLLCYFFFSLVASSLKTHKNIRVDKRENPAHTYFFLLLSLLTYNIPNDDDNSHTEKRFFESLRDSA